MQTRTNSTVAGTLSLLLTLPYLAPGPQIDVSGSNVFTSRFAGQPDRGRLLERLDEEQIRLISTVFVHGEMTGLTSQQHFDALLSFGKTLARKIYDLPPDFAAVISAKLPELL